MRFEPDGVWFIGYGNPLLGDDGAGPSVAASLRRCGLHAIAVPQLTPELADVVRRARLVVFIDANAAIRPGELRVTPVREAEDSVFEHAISPAALLTLAREVYHLVPEALLLHLGAGSYHLGRPLSAGARRAAREAVSLCRELAEGGLAPRPPR